MSYGPARGSQLIAEGKAPETTRGLVLTDGTVANSNFLGMYVNAPHKAAALVLMNFMMDPETQLSFYDPVNWGDMPTIDLNKLDPAMKAKFDAVDVGPATPSLDDLISHALPEINSAYAEPLQAGWVEFVLNK
jgi:putative spermidine/putrescine transport system substrate-binding protein